MIIKLAHRKCFINLANVKLESRWLFTTVLSLFLMFGNVHNKVLGENLKVLFKYKMSLKGFKEHAILKVGQ